MKSLFNNCLINSIKYKLNNKNNIIKVTKPIIFSINFLKMKAAIRYIKYVKSQHSFYILFLPHFYVENTDLNNE